MRVRWPLSGMAIRVEPTNGYREQTRLKMYPAYPCYVRKMLNTVPIALLYEKKSLLLDLLGGITSRCRPIRGRSCQV